MAIVWQDGRMVRAVGHGVRVSFEPMSEEGVEVLRMVRGGEFAPFSAYAEAWWTGSELGKCRFI